MHSSRSLFIRSCTPLSLLPQIERIRTLSECAQQLTAAHDKDAGRLLSQASSWRRGMRLGQRRSALGTVQRLGCCCFVGVLLEEAAGKLSSVLPLQQVSLLLCTLIGRLNPRMYCFQSAPCRKWLRSCLRCRWRRRCPLCAPLATTSSERLFEHQLAAREGDSCALLQRWHCCARLFFGGGCPSAVQLVEGRGGLAWLPCMHAAMPVAGHNACL